MREKQRRELGRAGRKMSREPNYTLREKGKGELREEISREV
jgi:hypothetical protein